MHNQQVVESSNISILAGLFYNVASIDCAVMVTPEDRNCYFYELNLVKSLKEYMDGVSQVQEL